MDSVGLGPVDTNLEGFLHGGGQDGRGGGRRNNGGVRTGANQMEN